MKDTKFRILLDIHEVRSQATIPVKVGDVSCKIYITLVEGGKPYKIHENSFGVFTGKKGDNNPIFNNCIIENGIIRYDFTPQTVAAAGVLECEIRIYDEDGGVLTTPSFNIVVDERAVNDSELASAPEFAFLDEILVNEGQRIENERNRNEAFNNLGIDLEDDGEVISIVKTDIDGSQEKASFLKYADVIPPVTATATGSAITVESSQAPLQNLKLYGKTEQDGTPTPDNPIELKSVGDSGSFEFGVYGKNLINAKLQAQSQNYGSLVAFDNTINIPKNTPITISVEVEATGETQAYWSTASGLIPATKYVGILKGKTRITHSHITTEDLHITNANILTKAPRNDGILITPINAQVEIGTQATPYEEYKGQTLTLTDTLRGIGDIADERDFARGVTTQRFNVVDLGTLNWNKETLSTGTYRFVSGYSGIARPLNAVTKANILCSAFDVITSASSFNGSYGIAIAHNSATICVSDEAYNSMTVEQFKSAMSGVMLVYELETPIETPLTETELNAYRHLMTNKPNTTILSEADMEISYYVNKPNAQAIGSLHEQINKDYFKLQQAIISTGGN